MNTDFLFQFLTMLFGGTSIISSVIAWQNRKSNLKSAEADSLKLTGEVYTLLTAITKNELAEMTLKLEKLEAQLEEYKRKCGQCIVKSK